MLPCVKDEAHMAAEDEDPLGLPPEPPLGPVPWRVLPLDLRTPEGGRGWVTVVGLELGVDITLLPRITSCVTPITGQATAGQTGTSQVKVTLGTSRKASVGSHHWLSHGGQQVIAHPRDDL